MKQTIRRKTNAIYAIATEKTSAYDIGHTLHFFRTVDGWTCYNVDTNKHYAASAAIIRETTKIQAQFDESGTPDNITDWSLTA